MTSVLTLLPIITRQLPPHCLFLPPTQKKYLSTLFLSKWLSSNLLRSLTACLKYGVILKKPLNIIGYLVSAVALSIKKFVVYLYKKPEDVCAKFF